MTGNLSPFTLEPKKLKAARDRVLREDAPLRDAAAPGSHAPRDPGKDKSKDLPLSIVRSAD